MSLELLIIIIVFFLLLQFFFAGSEIALISCDKIKIRSLAQQGSRSANLVLKAYEQIDKYISTTLVGINLSLITSTVILTYYIEHHYGVASEFYTVLILSPLIVIFGQVVPKAVFQQKRNTIILWAIYPLWITAKIFSPILFFVTIFTRSVLRLIGNSDSSITREELIYVIEGDKNAPMTDYENRVLKRIFGFSETTVDEIMIPLVKVNALDDDTRIAEALKMIKETGHSRIPVYTDRIDNITGILNAFYLLGDVNKEDAIKNYAHPPFYVPESKFVEDLLDEMKEGRAGMAVVVDEYGGAVGILTLEDILEEVVGEIEDEYDKGTKLWRKITEKEYLVNPVIEIEKINEDLGLAIPEGEYETLSGFLLEQFETIPKDGEKFDYMDKSFIVTKATSRSIIEVRIKKK